MAHGRNCKIRTIGRTIIISLNKRKAHFSLGKIPVFILLYLREFWIEKEYFTRFLSKLKLLSNTSRKWFTVPSFRKYRSVLYYCIITMVSNLLCWDCKKSPLTFISDPEYKYFCLFRHTLKYSVILKYFYDLMMF